MKIEVTILKEIKGAFGRVRTEEREGGMIQLYCNLNKLITWKETDQFGNYYTMRNSVKKKKGRKKQRLEGWIPKEDRRKEEILVVKIKIFNYIKNSSGKLSYSTVYWTLSIHYIAHILNILKE